MEKWVSYNASRRIEWGGHRSTDNVRKAIAYANRHRHELRIFSLGTLPGYAQPVFLEIHPSEWDVVFA